jgi:AcrR family transcriptional regulator
LEAVTSVLIEHPTATLAEVAKQVGIGRTTLHRLFATREDMLAAVAVDAIETVASVYQRAGIPRAFTPTASIDESWESFRRLAQELVPLGPRLMYLLRVDRLVPRPSVTKPMVQLDTVLEEAIKRGQDCGTIRRYASPNWLMESLYALIFVAWEHLRDGKLDSHEAANVIMEAWKSGVADDDN